MIKKVAVKRVAVVMLGVNNGSGDGGSWFGIEGYSKVDEYGLETDEIWSQKREVFVKYEAKVLNGVK